MAGTTRVLNVTAVLGLALALGALAACTPSAASSPVNDDNRELVVLLHGLGRSPSAMRSLAGRLEAAGYRVERPGYSSLDSSPDDILAEVSDKIAALGIQRAPRVHFVGHSLGGLLIRAFLADNEPANLGHVVVIGSPNHGTPLVDNLRGKWWFDMLGPMTLALGTGRDSFPSRLRPPDYPLGVIAGRVERDNDDLLPGPDDGLVTVASTKVEGMADFVVLDAHHAALRSDKAAAAHTVSFLKRGRFGAGAAHVD